MKGKWRRGKRSHSLVRQQTIINLIRIGQRSKKAGCSKGKQGARGPRGYRGLRGNRGLQGPRGPTGRNGARGISGPAGPRGPRGEQGPAGPPIQEILVEPVARRYFYFAEQDLVTEVNIPASQFVDDSGALSGTFAGMGINGFAHIFINGMLQEGRMYSLSQGALTLFLSEGDVIFTGTPIIIETVEYFVQFVQNQPT